MNYEEEARELLRRFLLEYDTNYHRPKDTPDHWNVVNQIGSEILNAPLELRRDIVRELPAAIAWSEENAVKNLYLLRLWEDKLIEETYVELPELAAVNHLNFALIRSLHYDYWCRPKYNHTIPLE